MDMTAAAPATDTAPGTGTTIAGTGTRTDRKAGPRPDTHEHRPARRAKGPSVGVANPNRIRVDQDGRPLRADHRRG